ncbi:telomere length regulation protein [Savitreella phatthalungensis]
MNSLCATWRASTNYTKAARHVMLPSVRQISTSGSKRIVFESVLRRISSKTTQESAPRGLTTSAGAFLRFIGRGMDEAAGKKLTEWTQLFQTSREDLKEIGLTPRQRKYLLRWREKYKHGEEPHELPVMKKVGGGERKRTTMSNK